MAKGITTYSEKIPGERRNYNWPVGFDKTDSFIGITQFETNGTVKDRVLLSRKQVTELLRFMEN